MKMLITIMAHKGAQETFDRNWPLWVANAFHHDAGILITCPRNSLLQQEPILALGQPGHHGNASILRFRALLMGLVKIKQDWYVIHEYDSLCLSNKIPDKIFEKPGLWANAFPTPGGDPPFKSKEFFHPPLVIDYDTLRQLTDNIMIISPHEERGFWDRWLGLACDLLNIQWHGYERLGYAINTIEPDLIPTAVEAVKNGAVMIHGIKTKEALSALKAVYLTK